MKFDLTNKSKDPLVLWRELVNKLSKYENIKKIELFKDGKKIGIKIVFTNSDKEYRYIGKDAIIALLKAEDKAYWRDLPF